MAYGDRLTLRQALDENRLSDFIAQAEAEYEMRDPLSGDRRRVGSGRKPVCASAAS